jgi:hypothetical protein
MGNYFPAFTGVSPEFAGFLVAQALLLSLLP